MGKIKRYAPPLHVKRRAVTMHSNRSDFGDVQRKIWDLNGEHDPFLRK